MLEIIDAGETKKRRAQQRPFGYYFLTLQDHIPWLKEQISKNEDGYIYFKKKDLENNLGLKVINFDSLLWALKFVLFENGMVIDKIRLIDGTRAFSIRFGTEDDVLPESLRRLQFYGD